MVTPRKDTQVKHMTSGMQGQEVRKYSIPLMFHTRMEPSLDAVIICSEVGAKHKQVTAL